MEGSRIKDITGEKRNRLEVLKLDQIKIDTGGKIRSYWRCRCDCGKEVVLRKDAFYYEYSHVKSCGCWHREESSMRKKDEKTGKYIKMH